MRLIFIAFCVLVFSTASHAASELPPLKVGMELSYPPFEMTDVQGRPAGVSVELAEALGRSLQRSVEIQNTSFDGLIPALQTKKIDLVISSMTATPERAVAIDFSDPYLTTGLCLLVPKSSTLQTAADLERPGERIAVKKGTTGHLFATKRFPKAQILVFDKESAAVLEVSQGKADAFIYDQMSVFQHWQKDPAHLKAILAPIQTEFWAIGLRKNDPLKARINAFLADFRKQGGFEKLGDKYLKQQKDAFKELGIPFVF